MIPYKGLCIPRPPLAPRLQFHHSNAQLDLLIGELREKLDEMQAQNICQRKRIADQETSRGRLQVRCRLRVSDADYSNL